MGCVPSSTRPFARLQIQPRIVLEVDGLAVLMDAVRAGIGATVQPGAATARLPQDAVARIELSDRRCPAA